MLKLCRKISKGVARIKLSLQDKLVLGNLDVKRDWDMPWIMWRLFEAKAKLSWQPKTLFEKLVRIMVEGEFEGSLVKDEI